MGDRKPLDITPVDITPDGQVIPQPRKDDLTC